MDDTMDRTTRNTREDEGFREIAAYIQGNACKMHTFVWKGSSGSAFWLRIDRDREGMAAKPGPA